MGELIIIRRDSVICLRLILILALIPLFSCLLPSFVSRFVARAGHFTTKITLYYYYAGSPFNIPTGIIHGSLIIPYPSKEINYILSGVYGA